MKLKWNRAPSAAEIVDDLLRAFEYAEARAESDLEPLAASAQTDIASAALRGPDLGSVEERGPPYGRGI